MDHGSIGEEQGRSRENGEGSSKNRKGPGNYCMGEQEKGRIRQGTCKKDRTWEDQGRNGRQARKNHGKN